jgi:hypothetical protein
MSIAGTVSNDLQQTMTKVVPPNAARSPISATVAGSGIYRPAFPCREKPVTFR